jgi:hypothetical protein
MRATAAACGWPHLLASVLQLLHQDVVDACGGLLVGQVEANASEQAEAALLESMMRGQREVRGER